MWRTLKMVRALVFVGALVVAAACGSFEADLPAPAGGDAGPSTTSSSSSSTTSSGTASSSSSSSSGGAAACGDAGLGHSPLQLEHVTARLGPGSLAKVTLPRPLSADTRLILIVATAEAVAVNLVGSAAWDSLLEPPAARPGLAVWIRKSTVPSAVEETFYSAFTTDAVGVIAEWPGIADRSNQAAITAGPLPVTATAIPVSAPTLVLGAIATDGTALAVEPCFELVHAAATGGIALGVAFTTADTGSPVARWTGSPSTSSRVATVHFPLK